MEEILARLLKTGIGCALVGDVANDDGVADELVLRTAQWIDHGARPEAASVLAHAPTENVVFAMILRDTQRILTKGFRTVIRRIEN